MNSSSVVACREIFDENSQPSAEEISDYACQLGIDPESETHLLPLARDGLMQALPQPWKAYFDEKLQSHYYYNEETKKTQWEHPLDHVYRELVKKARDASVLDDTCASVQELLTSEENTKNLERVETKVESDEDELITDSENHASDVKENALTQGNRRPMGRPPLGPLSRLDKKLGDLRISPLRRSVDSSISPKLITTRNPSERDVLSRPTFERPKTLFKQQSEIIDLKMHVLTSPEEENFSPLLSAKVDKGLPFTGKGNMFLRISRSNLPSPDTEKSSHLDSLTKSDPPKGILREKSSDYIQRKIESITGKSKQTASFDEDKKSVRFKLENLPDPTVSPGSNSSSEQNDGQSSIISAPYSKNPLEIPPFNPLNKTEVPSFPTQIPNVPLNSIVLSPLAGRPPIPPRIDSPREYKKESEKDSIDSEIRETRGTSPRRRLVKPPVADYIKPGLFQKNFQKISDLVRKTEIEPTNLEEPTSEKEVRPRSPLIPQSNKISINLMESIESETSIDSPDREFAIIDLNDFADAENQKDTKPKEDKSPRIEDASEKSNSKTDSLRNIPLIKIPKLDLKSKFAHSDSEDSKMSTDEPNTGVRSNSIDIPKDLPTLKLSPTPSLGSERPRLELNKPWSSPLSTFKPLNKAVTPLKSSDSLSKSLSPRLDGVMLSQGKSSTDNVVVVYQFETHDESPKIKSPIPDMGVREMVERNKADERRRLELNLQKELEMIRMEFSGKERRMRAELQTELREVEEKFLMEKSMRLSEQSERHKREMDEVLTTNEKNYQETLETRLKELENKFQNEVAATQRQHESNLIKIREDYSVKLSAQKEQLEIENERALADVRDQLQLALYREKARILEENRATVDALREEHTARITDLRHDYRAEVERLRSQHACHLEELRVRLSGERAAAVRQDDRVLHDKYRCLKEKYARLKHDVKITLERRNKRREMSMTTGSETEKSNSHKATQSLERCKELNETSVSAIIETEPPRIRINNNPVKCDNETSYSENVKSDNNNDDWKSNKDSVAEPAMTSLTLALKQSRVRRTGVAFREPPRRSRERERDLEH
ncbi:centrosomal protein of 164 kDa isoform X2 [Pieris rapae]|uniref:centrosomal protein of 164 kDa isoform X2 n=1 Tax=Pieris rapae TaxID=64459 RepID=UPI001E27F617|nr:centrosomal protein of 164 kDa isoform X2 [Pieris rapae]